MKKLIAAAFIVGMTLMAASPSFAQQAPATGTSAAQTGSTGKATQATKTKDLTPQQKKMKDCSREAKFKGLKGDPRKQFMSSCLKSD